MSAPAAHLAVRSHTWSVTSFADFAEFGGVGGGIWHFRFRNGSTHTEQDYLLMAGGVGGALEVPVSWLTSIGRVAISAFNDYISRAASFATASYTRCSVHGQVTFLDLAGARGAISCAQAGIGVAGGSAFGLNVMIPSLGAGPRIEADMSGFSYTLGAGVFAATGWLLPVGGGVADAVWNVDSVARARFARELARRPTDPVVRDLGHY
jgi:hypothetical protein